MSHTFAVPVLLLVVLVVKRFVSFEYALKGYELNSENRKGKNWATEKVVLGKWLCVSVCVPEGVLRTREGVLAKQLKVPEGATV